MIVKNEAHVIRRVLSSVKPFMTDWLIVDTGSTDGTQDIIREVMAGLPGQVVERPWQDFAHNRTEAINLAPAEVDYLFFIDADEEFVTRPGFRWPRLTKDAYDLDIHYGGTQFLRRTLVRRDQPWRWEGVLHEYLTGPENPDIGHIAGAYTQMYHEGARSLDPETYRKDAVILERAVKQEPQNSRYVFYLAQTYRDLGEREKSIDWYARRARMGGWIEEVWVSLYHVALQKERLGLPWPEVMQDYLTAHNTHPQRAEALYRVGMHYQGQQQYALAHLFLERAAAISHPPDALFVEQSIYAYHAALETAVAEYWLGLHREALNRYKALLMKPGLPQDIKDLIRRNQDFSLTALGQGKKK